MTTSAITATRWKVSAYRSVFAPHREADAVAVELDLMEGVPRAFFSFFAPRSIVTRGSVTSQCAAQPLPAARRHARSHPFRAGVPGYPDHLRSLARTCFLGLGIRRLSAVPRSWRWTDGGGEDPAGCAGARRGSAAPRPRLGGLRPPLRISRAAMRIAQDDRRDRCISARLEKWLTPIFASDLMLTWNFVASIQAATGIAGMRLPFSTVSMEGANC